MASRRKCDELVKAGRVSINGSTVLLPGTTIIPGKDSVQLDGAPLAEPPVTRYLILHKPAGYIVSAADARGRPTVLELVPAAFGRLFPVGRLDLDTEGLLIITNDGDLAHGLMHPSRGVEKRYEVLVAEVISEGVLEALRRGVDLGEGRKSSPAAASYAGPAGGGHLLRIALREGRKRQVRRMCKAVGLTVRRLVRTGVGPLELGSLKVGSWRELSADEVRSLKNEVAAERTSEAESSR
ncbi:MAG: rRNA pseudouridine synthase [Candidatus Eisenbacteria bacterium]|nr:rRNA pseudouridine synthase [Candidatus Eisenbacteria bacterium]